MFLTGVALGVIITFLLLTLYSCLVVAARADRQMEEMLKEHESHEGK